MVSYSSNPCAPCRTHSYKSLGTSVLLARCADRRARGGAWERERDEVQQGCSVGWRCAL